MSNIRDELRDELLAVTAARNELSPDDERYLVENFLEKLDREIDARISERAIVKKPRNNAGIVAIALGAAIPLSFIAVFAGWHGLLVTWVAILLVVYLTTRD